MKEENIIIGIDPGTNIMGYGIIEVKAKKMKLLTMGCVHLAKLSDPYLKLQQIFKRTLELIDDYHPDQLAIEAPFYGKNVQSMLKLGRAQGVSIAAALNRDLPITEYMPKKIKQSVTGNGNASKEQVAAMLSSLLKFEQAPKHFDATDGLAVAVCHYLQSSNISNTGKSYTGWASFLKDNPKRKIS